MSEEIMMTAIPGYENLYAVSPNGTVFNLRYDPAKPLAPVINPCTGYASVQLRDGEHRKRFYVHRLVAMTFILNPLDLREVNHIDANKLNNNVENLEWCSSFENYKHAEALGHITHGRIPVRVISLITGITVWYPSIKEVAKATNISRTTIDKYRKLKGKRFVIGDYEFEIMK